MEGIVEIEGHDKQQLYVHDDVRPHENESVNVPIQWQRHTCVRAKVERCKRHSVITQLTVRLRRVGHCVASSRSVGTPSL